MQERHLLRPAGRPARVQEERDVVRGGGLAERSTGFRNFVAEHPEVAKYARFRAAGERMGVDFASPRGERVLLAALEGQSDEARVVFVGEDAGVTVATLHTVRDGAATRTFLVIYGHLDRPGPGIVAGMRVHPGEVVAFTGDTGSKGIEQLYLEVRQVREGALPRLMPDETTVPKPRLADDALSIATDPRNVLAKK